MPPANLSSEFSAAERSLAQTASSDVTTAAHVSEFFAIVGAENGFTGVGATTFGKPTQVSIVLPHFAAKLFSVDEPQLSADAQLLSAVIDTFCRSVDNIADGGKAPERLAAGVQFSTLLLIKAVDIMQGKYKISLLDSLYSKGGMASAAERALYEIRSLADWNARGHARLLGEKNASLLIVPLMLNALSKRPWHKDQCEEFFLQLFTIVQDIDDVLDLEDDVRIQRYTCFQAHLENTLGVGSHLTPDKVVKAACNRIATTMGTLRQMVSTVPITPELEAELLEQVNSGVTAISSLQKLSSYSSFKQDAKKVLPPIVAYF